MHQKSKSIVAPPLPVSITDAELSLWFDALRHKHHRVFAPIRNQKSVMFGEVSAISEVDLEYVAAESPSGPKRLFYPPLDNILAITDESGLTVHEIVPKQSSFVIFGLRPCDSAAVNILDRVFLGSVVDEKYAVRRSNALTIVVNCQQAGPDCFCLSMKTGPFANERSSADISMTRIDDHWLIEQSSMKGTVYLHDLMTGSKTAEFVHSLEETRSRAIASFTKSIDIDGLAEILSEASEHPIFREIAESRCLGCANCTMVCPTCYCFNYFDQTSIGSTTTLRRRQWDSCQNFHFADVAHGSFRQSRKARLRQFVTHKLSTWIAQYGVPGCVGCGRCMTWCPTRIDLTDIAKAIQTSPRRHEDSNSSRYR